jgi:hypothetical protein
MEATGGIDEQKRSVYMLSKRYEVLKHLINL